VLSYLCGPEPLNDLHVLAEYGVSPHNIWGVESNEAAYRSALKELAQSVETTTDAASLSSHQLTSFRTSTRSHLKSETVRKRY
jgi:hypothetical protein